MAKKDKLTIITDPQHIKQGSGIVTLQVHPSNKLVYDYTSWKCDSIHATPPTIDTSTPIENTATIDINNLEPGVYKINVTAKPKPGNPELHDLYGDGTFTIELDFEAHAEKLAVTEGDIVYLTVKEPKSKFSWKLVKPPSTPPQLFPNINFIWSSDNENVVLLGNELWAWDTSGLTPGNYQVTVTAKDKDGNALGERTIKDIVVSQRQVKKDDVVPVILRHAASQPTADQALWVAIRNRTDAIGFKRFNEFVQQVFCEEGIETGISNIHQQYTKKFGDLPDSIDARLSIHAVDAYNVLRLATEVFLLLECGVVKKDGRKVTLLSPKYFDPMEESARLGDNVTRNSIEGRLTQYFGGHDKLPYLNRILNALLGPDPDRQEEKLPFCDGVLKHRFSCPGLQELIWSYWQEEGMLAQTMNAIALRFQNRRCQPGRDPLAELEIDPLRPLNNLLWGYIQNEHNRLTVPRRVYEYDHHYGLTLYGKAVPKLRSADSRSKFLDGFHNLLYRTSIFYKDDADTTVVADAFPLLNALREVHLVLAEGAHNQFGDLPWTARVEMLIEQWLLARPEMQVFLRGRPMVPYREEWMGRVDAMKKLQGWTDVSVSHFQELATYGEQILLTIRYGDWIDVNDENQAKNWARYWKPEIQGYIHAYRAVTGVDLTTEPVDATPPWVHLKRQEERRRGMRL
jgi:hypothetical protein